MLGKDKEKPFRRSLSTRQRARYIGGRYAQLFRPEREAILVDAPTYISPQRKQYRSSHRPILVGALTNIASSALATGVTLTPQPHSISPTTRQRTIHIHYLYMHI